MTLKRFSIIAAVIAGIIISLTIVLSCVKVNGNISGSPDKVIVYMEDTAGVTCYDNASNQRNKAHYQELVKRYKSMTNLSIMDYMLRGKAVNTDPSQDLRDKYDTWSYSNKSNYYCLELIYKNKQSVVVNVEGSTKVIEYYSLIMKVEKSTLSHEVAVYFSTTEDYDASKTYSASPILINANQNALYSYMSYMTTL